MTRTCHASGLCCDLWPECVHLHQPITCRSSGHTVSVPYQDWLKGTGTTSCITCGNTVTYQANPVGTSGFAKLAAHHTNGSPAR